MTIKQIAQKYKNKIDRLDLELLIAHALGKPREFLVTNPDTKIKRLENWKIGRLVNKRLQGIPLAYLTGHKEFFGLDFKVNKHTLIPRPDTEILVETTLQHLNTSTPEHTTLIDVGTGSGCIPISIAKTMKQCNNVTMKLFATDISKRALSIAQKNSKTHGTNINFLHGNLLSPISNFKFQISNLIITANLPYITEQQYQSEPSIHHEPKSALVANNNGLALYKKLLKQVSSFHFPHSSSLFLEIDPTQKNQITKIIKKYLPNSNVKTKTDLAGRDRVVIIEN